MMNEYQAMPNGLAFTRATLKIMKQYEEISQQFAEEDRLETTLQLNCLLGLLIVPQQHFREELQIEIPPTNENIWGIELSEIRYCGQHKSCKRRINLVDEIARHLRNSIAHGEFLLSSEDDQNISHVTFKDFLKGGVQTFELKILIQKLKQFVQKFYEEVFPEARFSS